MQYAHLSSAFALSQLTDAQAALVAAVADARKAHPGQAGWGVIQGDLQALAHGIDKIAAIGHAPFREWFSHRLWTHLDRTAHDLPTKGVAAFDALQPALSFIERIDMQLRELACERFIALAHRGDSHAVGKLVDEGIDINASSQTQRSPLHTYLTHPAFRNEPEERRERAVRILLLHGARVHDEWLAIPREPAIRALLEAAVLTQQAQECARDAHRIKPGVAP